MPAKAQELPNMKGAGVELPSYKDLDLLGDKFTETRDEKAKLATKLSDLEKKIIDLMNEKGLTLYRFGDQQMEIKETKLHVQVKLVKTEGTDSNGEE